jgi:hypothetical protein
MWARIEHALTTHGLFEGGELQQFLNTYATPKDGHHV